MSPMQRGSLKNITQYHGSPNESAAFVTIPMRPSLYSVGSYTKSPVLYFMASDLCFDWVNTLGINFYRPCMHKRPHLVKRPQGRPARPILHNTQSITRESGYVTFFKFHGLGPLLSSTGMQSCRHALLHSLSYCLPYSMGL